MLGDTAYLREESLTEKRGRLMNNWMHSNRRVEDIIRRLENLGSGNAILLDGIERDLIIFAMAGAILREKL